MRFARLSVVTNYPPVSASIATASRATLSTPRMMQAKPAVAANTHTAPATLVSNADKRGMKMRYAVYAGTDDPYEVWTESEPNVKHEKISGHETSDQAHTARKRYLTAAIQKKPWVKWIENTGSGENEGDS